MHHLENDNIRSISKVLEYIHGHLSDELRLEKLSDIASYSPFHFQKLFTRAMGESPKQYIIRLRLEKAAHYIRIFPNLKLTKLSENIGFASLATFSRAFKTYFGVSPEQYKNLPSEEFSKICKVNGKKSKIAPEFSTEFWKVNFLQTAMDKVEEDIKITVKKVQEKQLFFSQTCLETDDSITLAFRKLYKWADSRALVKSDSLYIGNLLDIPFITPIEKCRYRVCITSNIDWKESNGFTKGALVQGLYASYLFKGDIFAMIKSLVWFNHHWIPDSGYKIADITGFEIYSENPSLKPLEQIQREILIPILPA